MFRVHCDVLDITHPKTNESEERTAPFPHALFPTIVPEHLRQLTFSLMVFLLLLNHFVKVVFPVEHQTEGRLALQTLGEALFTETELCASPLFYLWV